MLYKIVFLTQFFIFSFSMPSFASDKQSEFAGQFYPAEKKELAATVDGYLQKANPESIKKDILAILVPHAGYGYSAGVAAYAYKLIKNHPYKTVVILGTAHRYAFNGFSVYTQGYFITPLGKIQVDQVFAESLIGQDADIVANQDVFKGEHSVEVQLPFLQSTLGNFKIVPVVCGDVTFNACQKFAEILKVAMGIRKEVLIVVSTDMYHGYDLAKLEDTDQLTLSYLKNLDSEGLYYGLRDEKLQLCGGFGAVTALILAKQLGYKSLDVLKHTNSALVMGVENKSDWVVGYSSCAIYRKEEDRMFTNLQKKKLLQIARNAIEMYLKAGKKIELKEDDPIFLQKLGAFVTLNKNEQLRGCIGNMVGSGPLYLTIKDMAVESAIGDPRFVPVKIDELKDIKIEISVLTPLEKIDSPDKIILGKHGVMVRKGFATGVFLPQVAKETGWSKEEFLSHLCADKAGIPALAWKDGSAQLYVFEAEVFSEEEN